MSVTKTNNPHGYGWAEAKRRGVANKSLNHLSRWRRPPTRTSSRLPRCGTTILVFCGVPVSIHLGPRATLGMKSAGLARGLAATHELVQHDLRHEALSDLWCITRGTVEGKRYTYVCERRRLAHGKPAPYPCKTCSVGERAFYVCRVNLPSPVWVAAASVGLAMGFHDTAGLIRCPVLMMQDKSIPKAVLTHGFSPFAYR